MATKRRRAKRLRRAHVRDPEHLKYLSELDAGMHRFNAAGASRREAEDYVVSQFDHVGEMGLKLVRDRASALDLAQELDLLIAQMAEWLPQWTGLARIPGSEAPATLHLAEFRERLLRRAEHWKSEAHATVAAQTEETPKQRGLRRQWILDPLLRRAGISSDDAWAERAGAGTDRNTPRDYRSGKTKKLRKANRETLAEALGISASELPD
jgi:hypothetical protein